LQTLKIASNLGNAPQTASFLISGGHYRGHCGALTKREKIHKNPTFENYTIRAGDALFFDRKNYTIRAGDALFFDRECLSKNTIF
jgi:hypothetical protein